LVVPATQEPFFTNRRDLDEMRPISLVPFQNVTDGPSVQIERFAFCFSVYHNSKDCEQIAASNGDKLDFVFRHLSRRGWAWRSG
jgi:hypothetical protein